MLCGPTCMRLAVSNSPSTYVSWTSLTSSEGKRQISSLHGGSEVVMIKHACCLIFCCQALSQKGSNASHSLSSPILILLFCLRLAIIRTNQHPGWSIIKRSQESKFERQHCQNYYIPCHVICYDMLGWLVALELAFDVSAVALQTVHNSQLQNRNVITNTESRMGQFRFNGVACSWMGVFLATPTRV